MKTLLLAFVFLLSAASLVAQDSTAAKVYKNEFGLDMTGFVRQFLNFGGNDNFYYDNYFPTYYIAYRRFFAQSNMRAALGFEYSGEDAPGFQMGDSVRYEAQESNIVFRVGYEKSTSLDKRWEAYYGLDFLGSFSRAMDEYTGSNAGYRNGYDRKTNTLGLAPLLGFRFKISKRLSLTTEANLSFNVQKTTNTSMYEPLPTTNLPPKKDEVKTTDRVFFTFILHWRFLSISGFESQKNKPAATLRRGGF